MTNSIVSENQKKLKNYNLFHLICFSMFSFWQMGFVYFMGPSLTINGRTPLPVSMDNITVLIAIAYVFSIAFMLVLPKLVVWAERITAMISLLTALGLFFPFSDDALKMLIYAQVFCCCFMIGFETFIIVNYFSEKNAIVHMTFAYGIAVFLIAMVQNDFLSVTFPVFRIATVAALILLIVFSFSVSSKKEYCPRYVKKSDNAVRPQKLLVGAFILVFIGSLMAVSGPSISGEIRHGVFITYIADAVVSIAMYCLYRFLGIHPFRLITACLAVGGVGFLLMFAATDVPVLSYVSCAFIGVGMVPCQMLPLYNVVLMKSYPSRFLAPLTIGLALVAVLVQSSMVEIFRSLPSMLYLVYAIVMVVLVIVYLQMEPYFLYTLKKKIPEVAEDSRASELDGYTISTGAVPEENGVLSVLTKRELEVVDLIAGGYSNGDIAEMLYISLHTVNDHTKNIYRKLEVHSRYELMTLVNKSK